MDYTIFFWGGKQYRAGVGQVIGGEKLAGEEGSKHVFDQVLLCRMSSQVLIGDPYLKNAKLETTVVKQGKDKKIVVSRYKAKSRYRKTQGHRQPRTWVRLDKILVKGVK